MPQSRRGGGRRTSFNSSSTDTKMHWRRSPRLAPSGAADARASGDDGHAAAVGRGASAIPLAGGYTRHVDGASGVESAPRHAESPADKCHTSRNRWRTPDVVPAAIDGGDVLQRFAIIAGQPAAQWSVTATGQTIRGKRAIGSLAADQVRRAASWPGRDGKMAWILRRSGARSARYGAADRMPIVRLGTPQAICYRTARLELDPAGACGGCTGGRQFRSSLFSSPCREWFLPRSGASTRVHRAASSPLPDRRHGNRSKSRRRRTGRRYKKGRRQRDWQTSENVIKTSWSATTLGVVCSESSQEGVGSLVTSAAAEAWRSG